MNAAKTTAERVAKVKEAKRAAGLREVRSLWAYPEDHAAIRAYAAKLAKKRAAKMARLMGPNAAGKAPAR